MVYLDYNATTPTAPEVVEKMALYWTDLFYNPSSAYPEARLIQQALEDSRRAVSTLVDAPPETIVFTSGGSESNNGALRQGFSHFPERRRLVVSAIEHPSIIQMIPELEALGAEVAIAPVNDQGVVRMEELEKLIDNNTALVSIMLAQNEIGAIQPLAEVARLAHSVGALVHTDAAQAIGKIPVHVDRLDVDLMTVAAHKFYGPKGIGALYVRPGLAIRPLVFGGGQERGLRSGTLNVPAIMGMGRAAQLALEWLSGPGPSRQESNRNHLQTQLINGIPGLTVLARDTRRLPNTLAVAIPGLTGADLLQGCPEIRASVGSACHRPDDQGSPTLLAMGLSPSVARGLVRLSLGRHTSPVDIDRAAQALIQSYLSLSRGAV